jgi:hypothetical protein
MGMNDQSESDTRRSYRGRIKKHNVNIAMQYKSNPSVTDATLQQVS